MAIARKEVVIDGVEGVYHVVTRCVRRAFLCGEAIRKTLAARDEHLPVILLTRLPVGT